MFKHTPRLVTSPHGWCFFLMLNQNSGAVDVYGIMQSVITVLSSHMLLYVPLYIVLFIHIHMYIYNLRLFFKKKHVFIHMILHIDQRVTMCDHM
jgi:hypothetical protein